MSRRGSSGKLDDLLLPVEKRGAILVLGSGSNGILASDECVRVVEELGKVGRRVGAGKVADYLDAVDLRGVELVRSLLVSGARTDLDHDGENGNVERDKEEAIKDEDQRREVAKLLESRHSAHRSKDEYRDFDRVIPDDRD
mgnify:FL=1